MQGVTTKRRKGNRKCLLSISYNIIIEVNTDGTSSAQFFKKDKCIIVVIECTCQGNTS